MFEYMCTGCISIWCKNYLTVEGQRQLKPYPELFPGKENLPVRGAQCRSQVVEIFWENNPHIIQNIIISMKLFHKRNPPRTQWLDNPTWIDTLASN